MKDSQQDDQLFMKRTLELAQKAADEDEVPVGALVVKEGVIIAEAYNQKEKTQLVTKHAEIIALEKACERLKSWRLRDCILYVSLEPCLMCAGAIYQTRLSRVVY